MPGEGRAPTCFRNGRRLAWTGCLCGGRPDDVSRRGRVFWLAAYTRVSCNELEPPSSASCVVASIAPCDRSGFPPFESRALPRRSIPPRGHRPRPVRSLASPVRTEHRVGTLSPGETSFPRNVHSLWERDCQSEQIVIIILLNSTLLCNAVVCGKVRLNEHQGTVSDAIGPRFGCAILMGWPRESAKPYGSTDRQRIGMKPDRKVPEKTVERVDSPDDTRERETKELARLAITPSIVPILAE